MGVPYRAVSTAAMLAGPGIEVGEPAVKALDDLLPNRSPSEGVRVIPLACHRVQREIRRARDPFTFVEKEWLDEHDAADIRVIMRPD
jgi:hypothetical protein